MKANNLTLRQMRVFVAVADHGSFVGAANALGLSQPALSQSVRQLEEEVGSRLFMRTTRRVQLTGVGLSFLPQVRHLLRQLDDMVANIQDMVERRRGRVVLGCVPSVAWRMMPPVLAKNTELFPGITVVVRDTSMRLIKELLASGELDVALGNMPSERDALSAIPVARDRMHAVFPRGHPLEALPVVPWGALSDYPFIAMTPDTGIREIVDSVVLLGHASLDVTAELSNLATVNGYVQQGLGVTALPGLALPRDDHPAIAHRPLAEPELGRTIA
ncbi:MAG: LysR substrate-binding domain-containing protein, partial [Pseudomonadota bacterium]